MSSTRTVTVLADPVGRARALRYPAVLVKVTRGPDRRKQQRLGSGRMVVGSRAPADFVLTDPGVSALHLELSGGPAGLAVKDLGSKNGVWLSGQRIYEAALLRDDELTIGESVLRLKFLDEEEETALPERSRFGGLTGSSPRMRALYADLERAAASDQPVLLQGEAGSGKSTAAEALVQEGPRKDGPLAVVDCATLEAFDPALFSRAAGGTVVLEEIGDLPAAVQGPLSVYLERRAGDAAPRILSTTSRPLEREVNRGAFRAELLYRLAVLVVRIPALRERREDIPELVSQFLEELPGGLKLPPPLLERLFAGDYGGNLRELRSAVERAAVGLDPAPGPIVAPPVDLATPFRVQKERLVDGFERAYLSKLLEATRGNVSEAARRSGIPRVYLHELIRKLGLAVR